MIEVKKEMVKINGEKRIIKAEFAMLVHSLVDSGSFSKEEIEEAVERGCMTDWNARLISKRSCRNLQTK